MYQRALPRHSRSILLCLIAVFSAVSQSSIAQLIPDHLYNGIGQRIVLTVNAPDDFPGELTIKLHDPQSLEVLQSAPAAKGRIDLAGLFPMLWSDKSEKVMLAQLYLDDQAIGAPVVLQPLVTPNRAKNVDPNSMKLSEEPSTAIVVFEDDRRATQFAKKEVDSPDREKIFSGLRIYIDQEAVIETTQGEIVFRLRPDAAPNTAYNFMHLIEGGFYTNIIFHRIVAALADGRPFVIQVGDPSGTGSGGPGYMIDLEKSDLQHDFGVLSMARSFDPDTNGSQIFVCLSREGTAFLDGRYTAFAQAIAGAKVIREIAKVQVDQDDRPIDPPMILKAYLRQAPAITGRVGPISATTEPQTDFVKQEPER